MMQSKNLYATLLICNAVVTPGASAESAKDGDVSSIEAIIAASFDSLSGTRDAPRQWERYLSLLDPAARLVSTSFDATSGRLKITRWSRDEYARAVNDYLVTSAFTDRKLGCLKNQYGSAAMVECGFEGLEEARVVERGVAFYQLYYDGTRWWILSVAWDQERPGHPIPARLLVRDRWESI